VIVTDNEGALLKALDNVYPDIPHLLCRWHAEKNVLTKAFSIPSEYNQLTQRELLRIRWC
jgi:hypothetical protein